MKILIENDRNAKREVNLDKFPQVCPYCKATNIETVFSAEHNDEGDYIDIDLYCNGCKTWTYLYSGESNLFYEIPK
jgi:hypothetical protein